VRIEGEKILARLIAQRQPVILLTPHFLGLDLGGTRMAPPSTASASTPASATR
jgi:lauroyl/myristoyl acyltransferase